LTFSIFAAIHLTNTSLIPLITRSIPASETYLIQAREIYQTPFTEPLLVGLPIVAHVASGLALRVIRRSQNLKRYGGSTPGTYALHRSRTVASSDSSGIANPGSRIRTWPPLSYISVSGYVFTTFFCAHVGVNRALPLQVGGDSSNIGLGYVAHGFARHGILAWFAYSGLIVFGCGHMVWGLSKWFGIAPAISTWSSNNINGVVDKSTRKQWRRAWWTIHAVAVFAAGLWAAGGLGIVGRGGLTEGWIGNLYDELFSKLGW
jgi:Protein of unknown function (DUF1691)